MIFMTLPLHSSVGVSNVQKLKTGNATNMKRIEIVSIEKLKGSMNDENIAMYIVETKQKDGLVKLFFSPVSPNFKVS